MKRILFTTLIFLCSLSTFSQLPTLRTKVSLTDKIDFEADKEFGVGDDGIYNIVEPTVKASSELKQSNSVFNASNITDFNLATPWIEAKADDGIGEHIEFLFDLREAPQRGNALSISSFFIINGYRKNVKVWKDNSRVKKLKMFINNKPFAYILLADTYKFQSVDFPEQWFKYGQLSVVRFEIVATFPGDKYKDTAIGEIQFSGRYHGNM